MHEELAFVIIGPAGVDGVFAGCRVLCQNGFKWVCAPFFQRFRRLYVIVPVDQYGLFCANVLASENDRVAGGLIDIGTVCPGFFQELSEPLRAAVHILFVFRLSTY